MNSPHTTSRTTTLPATNSTSQLERSAADQYHATVAAVKRSLARPGPRRAFLPAPLPDLQEDGFEACEVSGREGLIPPHYLMVTDEDFARAAEKAVQNPVHSAAVSGLQWPSDEKETAVSPAFTSDTAFSVPPRGVEPRFSD